VMSAAWLDHGKRAPVEEEVPMSKIVWYRVAAAIVLALLTSAPVLGQPVLTDSGFTENFDSMGRNGTSPPNGWSVYTIPGDHFTWQPCSPVLVTGYSADVISDKSLATRFAQPFDANTFAWFEAGAMDDNGVQHNDGLPASLVSSIYRTGTLARYQIQSNDVNVLQLSAGQTGTLTLTTSAAYSTLYVLASSGTGTSSSVGSGIINFANGSTQAFSYNAFDWCNGQGGLHPEAVLRGLNGRADVGPDGTAFIYNQDCDYQVYETALAIDPSHAGVAITSIDFTGAPDAFFSNIFAVSTPTGIVADQMSPELFGSPSTGLTAVLDPTGRANNGYNAATSAAPDDRALSTSPTGVAGAVLELMLTNNTGRTVTSLSISYDIRRFTVGSGTTDYGTGPGADEIPGYWLFYSLDGGGTYTNVSQLNTDINSVPNTVGVTHMAGQFDLSSPLADGQVINLCWVDDNGIASSPDQILGLDNVVITAP
jgi:hypothetical protein